MNKWKLSFFILLFVCIVGSCFIIYEMIDQAYTITYLKQGYDDTESDLKVLSDVISKKALNKNKIIEILEENKLHFFETNSRTIILSRTQLIFDKTGILDSAIVK